MPSLSTNHGVMQWFAYLQEFQNACSFNTSTVGISPLAFSKLKPSTILPSANQQSNFCAVVTGNTALPVSTTVLAAAASFLDLLNKYYDLPTLIEIYLKKMSEAPYSAGTLTDFLNLTATKAFGGDSTGNQWQTAIAGLASGTPPAMPPSCFSTNLQTKVAGMVNADTPMSNICSQIASLG